MTFGEKLKEAFKKAVISAHAWAIGALIGKTWERGQLPTLMEMAYIGITFFMGFLIMGLLVEHLKDKDWKYNPFYSEDN